MRYNPIVNPSARLDDSEQLFCQASNVDSKSVSGLLELAPLFDIILFSAEDILVKNGMTQPAGAVVVPSLRKLDKRLGVFSFDPAFNRDEMTRHFNYHGYSFTAERMFDRKGLHNLKQTFPLMEPERVLMVCSDVVEEVKYAYTHGFKSLLISNDPMEEAYKYAIQPHYVALNV